MLSQVKENYFSPKRGDGSKDLAFWFHFLLMQYVHLGIYLKSTKTFHLKMVLELLVQMHLFITAVITRASDTIE